MQVARFGGTGIAAMGVACALFVTGCTNSSGDPAPTSPRVPSAVFRQHIQTPVETPTKSFGEDCGEHGPSECLSNLCLHTAPGPTSGWICSAVCTNDGECPSNFHCLAVHSANPDAKVCVPRDFAALGTDGGAP